MTFHKIRTRLPGYSSSIGTRENSYPGPQSTTRLHWVDHHHVPTVVTVAVSNVSVSHRKQNCCRPNTSRITDGIHNQEQPSLTYNQSHIL